MKLHESDGYCLNSRGHYTTIDILCEIRDGQSICYRCEKIQNLGNATNSLSDIIVEEKVPYSASNSPKVFPNVFPFRHKTV